MEINETFWNAIELLAWLVMFVIALGIAEMCVTIVLSIVDKVRRIYRHPRSSTSVWNKPDRG